MITDEDIRRTVAPNAFLAGQKYQLGGRVRAYRIAADGTSITAEVLGSGKSPYRQRIRLVRTRGGDRIKAGGSCTCPVGSNCKHVAAVLFEYQRRSGGPAGRAGDARTGGSPAASSGAAGALLPIEVEFWLRSLAAAQAEESEDYPADVSKRLLYVLDRSLGPGGLTVGLQTIDLGRDGIGRDGIAGSVSRDLQADALLRRAQQARYLRPSDRAILERLARGGGKGGEAFIFTLRGMIATGRARWAAWDGPALSEGEPVLGELGWAVADDGGQRPELALPGRLVGLNLAVPWYVDPATGVVGPVETALPARVVQAMLDGPALPPAMAAHVRDEMARRWPGGRLPQPRAMAAAKVLCERLQPHLLLLACDLPAGAWAASAAPHRGSASSGAMARLSWRYGRVRIPGGLGRQPGRVVQQDGVLFEVVRDAGAEDRAAERLLHLGLVRIDQQLALPPSHPQACDLMLTDADPAAWIEFVLDDVPALRAEGWLVQIADDFPLRLVEPDGAFAFEIEQPSGVDWFDLDLGVMVEGERVSLVPALLDVIAGSGASAALGETPDDGASPLLLPLADGRLLVVKLDRLQPILAPLLELFGSGEMGEHGLLRLKRRSAGDLALVETGSAAAGIAWSGGKAVRALGRQLRAHGGIPPCAVPAGFLARLRGYQEQGLAWLQFLRAAGLGGVLADDMGLGKTIQALAHLVVEQEEGRLDRPALVICPTSLVPNWQAEAARFAPGLRTLVLHGPDRSESFAQIGGCDLVITTYPLLGRDHAVLGAQDWHVVILDEAQIIKNPLAITSKLARTLQARQRLCLSGTPLENHLGELWSLFDFLLPGFLGDSRQFGRRYRGPIEKAGNMERRDLLAQRIAPFLLRRTKAQVAADLPPKTEIAETVELGDGQRALYEGIRLAMHAKVQQAIATRGLAGSGIIILDALLKLRQACCDPRLIKLRAARAAKARSAKLERLLEMLPQMLEEGHSVLLFSQFTSMLALIEAELERLGLDYVTLTGRTRDRTAPMRRFQAGEVKLFLISLKAGGVGLNLTAADTVIHYDPWWNPAVEDQATDRAHRIGQDKAVFVHRLTAAGTIEEKMEVLKERKQALAAGILGGGGGAALGLTEGDLEMLFAPA